MLCLYRTSGYVINLSLCATNHEQYNTTTKITCIYISTAIIFGYSHAGVIGNSIMIVLWGVIQVVLII